jgi:hypothetical protein
MALFTPAFSAMADTETPSKPWAANSSVPAASRAARLSTGRRGRPARRFAALAGARVWVVMTI